MFTAQQWESNEIGDRRCEELFNVRKKNKKIENKLKSKLAGALQSNKSKKKVRNIGLKTQCVRIESLNGSQDGKRQASVPKDRNLQAPADADRRTNKTSNDPKQERKKMKRLIKKQKKNLNFISGAPREELPKNKRCKLKKPSNIIKSPSQAVDRRTKLKSLAQSSPKNTNQSNQAKVKKKTKPQNETVKNGTLNLQNDVEDSSFDRKRDFLESNPSKTNPSKTNPKLLKFRAKLQTMQELNADKAQVKGRVKKPTLKQRMMEKLKASRFRYLNEQIYTNSGKEAQAYFKKDPDAYSAYHEGYRQQIARWPLNPLDVIIKSISKMPSDHVIADFGCGDARLAKSVPQKVHSFDLVANNDCIIACDMANVPLGNSSVNVAVFCLSLMGTNLKEYITEANRILKIGGTLKIAEVESRFDTVDSFIEGVQHFGFAKTWKDLSHNLFYFLDFKKTNNCKQKKNLPTISLHPCLYKKR